jgi:CHAT domain-containing protein
MLCKKTSRSEFSMLKQRSTVNLISVLNMLKLGVMVLLVLSSVAGAQLVQTIDSEAQLASALCRKAKGDVTIELLLDKDAQLINVTLWKALLDCASSAERQGSPAKSIEIYKLALRVGDRIKKPELAATTYYYLGRTYSGINDFENALQAYETSRTVFEQAGIESNLTHVLADLGALYFTVEDYEKARNYSERSLAIAEQIKSSTNESLPPVENCRARALHTLGQIDLRHGNPERALNKLREALALYERLNSTNSSYNLRLAEALITIGRGYGEMGQYRVAFSCLNRAHQVSKSSGDQTTRAKIMSGQASLFLEQEDYASAQTWFNTSLAIYRSQGNEREQARVLLNLAVTEQRQGRHNNALQLFQRSIERANAAKLVDIQIAAGQGLGVIFAAKRDFPNALKAINQSLELARRVNAKTREAELLWCAAQTYYAMQNYRESAALAEQALTLARSLGLLKLTYLATAALGEAYAADEKVELAITFLNQAINQVEELRDRVAGPQDRRQLFFEHKVGPYHTMVKLLTRQGKNFEALVYAERAKGRVLLEAVRNNRDDLQGVPTQEQKIEAQRLINKLSELRQRMQTELDGDAKSHLQKQLDAARHELRAFEEKLAAAHPEVLVRTGPAKTLTQANISALIPADDFAYLEYVVTRDDVGLFILKRKAASTDHDLKYIKLPVNVDTLRRKVSDFHTALANRHPDHAPLGRELYQLLIEPAAPQLQNITTLCIVPDEFLWTLPFQALTNTSGNYVIQEYSLVYAPSLSVLNEMVLHRQQPSSKRSLLAFGNPIIDRDEKRKQALHPLPEAEAEVAAVATAVRTEKKRVLIGRRADEKSFRALAPHYATIHLATHGVLDNTDPLNSYLLFTKTVGDREHDGLLQAREVLEMRLNADLAVLSACETGSGRISPGEGVVGMSWAFLVAGARSVLVSQWRVNSASTAQLMKNFYQALAQEDDPNSRNKSLALREASLGLLKDRRHRHPFYWAGFVLVSGN